MVSILRRYSLTNVLLITNIILFIFQYLISGFTNLLLLRGIEFWPYEPWTLITHMFIHGSLTHLLFNMYVLFMFGNLLENRIGSKRFGIIYFASGIIAAIISSFFYDGMLGASGAIMGMIGALIILMPNLELLFFFIIPMKLWVAGIIIFLIDVIGGVSASYVGSNVGHIAHIVGMICGLLIAYYFKKQISSFKKKIKGEVIVVRDASEYMKNK